MTDGTTIRFVLDDEIVELSNVNPTRTVLQYLREDLRRTGTKEGCAEGDCGACTVAIAEVDAEGRRLQVRAVNACIQFLPTLDGKELITVENLKMQNGALHPVQRAMVDCHGSQCGFCTPGFVMSLFALYKNSAEPGRKEIDVALAGNLCRCTGYQPIVNAARAMYAESTDGNWLCEPNTATRPAMAGEQRRVERLRGIRRKTGLSLRRGEARYFAPTTIFELADLYRQNPDAVILAGGTDVGLWVTKQQRDLPTVIYCRAVPELASIVQSDEFIDIGAGATLSDAVPPIVEEYPELSEMFERFASPPIRNAATLGGNIANGSPIGDSMPALMVLDTMLSLRAGEQSRRLPLNEFFLGYQQTALAPGEFVERILVPRRNTDCSLQCYKVSKRFDQDISAVCGAFFLRLDGDTVASIRIAYGGLAAVPMRAPACERVLIDQHWGEQSLARAVGALDADFTPITDMRASADYRRQLSHNLLRRFFLETTGDSVGRVYAIGR